MQCKNCEFKKVDKEWSKVYGCKIQDELKLTVLLAMGNSDKCPYYTRKKKEYDFGFK